MQPRTDGRSLRDMMLACGLVVLVAGCGGSDDAASRVSMVATFDLSKGEAAESVAIGGDSTRYVSLTASGTIAAIAPDGTQRRMSLPIAGAVLGGLAFDAQGRLWVAVTSAVGPLAASVPRGVWRFDAPASNAPGVLVAVFPDDATPNGLAFNAGGDLFIADSGRGSLWRLAHDSTTPVEAVHDPDFLPDPVGGITVPNAPTFQVPGINGLKFFGSVLYLSVSSRALILRCDVAPDGSVGPVSIAYRNLVSDDFAFDRAGNLYATTNGYSNRLVRVAPDGGTTILAGPEDGLNSPSAVAFGRNAEDHVVFIANLGVFLAPNRPSLLGLDVGSVGLALP